MRFSLLLPMILFALHAQAADVYKCTAADGSIGFQDHPCGAGTRQQRLQLQDPSPPPSPPATPATDAVPPTPAAAPPAAAPAPPPAPAADVYLCLRYDGTRYLSDSGVGARHWVPYAMLGGSGMSLAEAYGGRDGIGVSAPGLRQPPNLPAAQNPIAGAYVWVEDECRLTTPQQACAFLQSELERVQSRLRRAFSDTEADLKREAQSLRERMRGC
jgi:hypothetical protein